MTIIAYFETLHFCYMLFLFKFLHTLGKKMKGMHNGEVMFYLENQVTVFGLN